MTNKLIDKREPGFFIVDNEVLEEYDLNVYEIAIYVLLAKFTGRKDNCFPSLNTISKKLKISKPTVIKGLNSLEEKNLIGISKNKNGEEYDNNIYIMKQVKKKVYNSGVVNQVYQVVNEEVKGSKSDLPPVVNEVYSNNTHKNIDDEQEGLIPKESLFDDPMNSSSCFDELKKNGITDKQIDDIKTLLKVKDLKADYVQNKINQFQWLEKNNPVKYQKYKNKTAALLKSITDNWIDQDYEKSKNRPPSPKLEEIKYQADYLKASRILDFYRDKTGIEIELTDDFQRIVSRCKLAADEIEFLISESIDNKLPFDLRESLKDPDLRTVYNDLKLAGLNEFKSKFTGTPIELKPKTKAG